MSITDLQKLNTLLKDFYNLTGIKICIYDNSEEELCYYPEKLSAFCSLLRENKEMEKHCLQCDRNAFATCKRTHEQHLYTCHAGLLECVSPILFDGKIWGYIVLGQIKTEKNSIFSLPDNTFPKETYEELKKRFDALPFIPLEKLHSAMHVLDACAGYEYLKKIVSLSNNRIDLLLDAYINEQIAGDLSVSALCSKFHLSHNEIYSIFNEFFRSTPAEYVKIRRLQYACSLLKNSSLPINKIAIQCGIPDYNYFSKVFKKEIGVSPSQFKRELHSPIQRISSPIQ
jgi:AraC-like DNA-binding protein